MNHDRRPAKPSDSGGQSTIPEDLQSMAEEPGPVARPSTLDSNDKRNRQQRLIRLRDDRLSSIADMAVALTHEVTQPLTAAANLVSAARRLVGGAAPDAVAALDKAEAQMVRAGRMISRMREFIARSEPETVEQSLHKVIQDASELAAPVLRDADVNLTFRLEAVADLVLVDRVEIEQALVNLLRYALEAGGGSPGRTVTIATSVANGFIQTDIVDATAESTEAAEPNSSQLLSPAGVRGLGDGLSVARSIIDAHGGRVLAGRGGGSGAMFSFTLPLVEQRCDDG
jgi:C4-dicarboxylate-specific signal transduction histidine kinase